VDFGLRISDLKKRDSSALGIADRMNENTYMLGVKSKIRNSLIGLAVRLGGEQGWPSIDSP